MNSIRESLYYIAVIVISTGIIEIFSGSGRLQKYTKFVVSLVVILSLMYPLGSLTKIFTEEIPNLNVESESELAEANEQLKKTLENSIKESIETNLSVPSDAFDVKTTISRENNEIIIKNINITITNKSYFRYAERIEAYLKSNFGCEIYVLQDFKE